MENIRASTTREILSGSREQKEAPPKKEEKQGDTEHAKPGIRSGYNSPRNGGKSGKHFTSLKAQKIKLERDRESDSESCSTELPSSPRAMKPALLRRDKRTDLPSKCAKNPSTQRSSLRYQNPLPTTTTTTATAATTTTTTTTTLLSSGSEGAVSVANPFFSETIPTELDKKIIDFLLDDVAAENDQLKKQISIKALVNLFQTSHLGKKLGTQAFAERPGEERQKLRSAVREYIAATVEMAKTNHRDSYLKSNSALSKLKRNSLFFISTEKIKKLLAAHPHAMINLVKIGRWNWKKIVFAINETPSLEVVHLALNEPIPEQSSQMEDLFDLLDSLPNKKYTRPKIEIDLIGSRIQGKDLETLLYKLQKNTNIELLALHPLGIADLNEVAKQIGQTGVRKLSFSNFTWTKDESKVVISMIENPSDLEFLDVGKLLSLDFDKSSNVDRAFKVAKALHQNKKIELVRFWPFSGINSSKYFEIVVRRKLDKNNTLIDKTFVFPFDYSDDEKSQLKNVFRLREEEMQIARNNV